MKRYVYLLALGAGLVLTLAGILGATPWAAAEGQGPLDPALPSPLPTTPPSPLPTPPSTCASTFADVRATDFFSPAVQYLACHAIVSGYTCGGPGEPCNAAK